MLSFPLSRVGALEDDDADGESYGADMVNRAGVCCVEGEILNRFYGPDAVPCEVCRILHSNPSVKDCIEFQDNHPHASHVLNLLHLL